MGGFESLTGSIYSADPFVRVEPVSVVGPWEVTSMTNSFRSFDKFDKSNVCLDSVEN